MINRFEVRNYKALRDVSLSLTPVHVLIGPNDAGKTSILTALAALSRTTDMVLQSAFAGAWEGRELVWHNDPDGVVSFAVELADGDVSEYRLACRFPNAGRSVRVEHESIAGHVLQDDPGRKETWVRSVCVNNAGAPAPTIEACRKVYDKLAGVQYFRWNPRTLALPVAPDSKRRFRLNSDGFGLALLLDDILGYDRKQFEELETRFRGVFPEITSIKLLRQAAYRAPIDDLELVSRLETADGKGIYFEVRGNKQLVPASQASDGAVLVLAYIAVLYSPQQPRILLIEEPENGIHPKRLGDVVQVVRELVKAQTKTQVVLTTHSPYAVSLFEAEEVTLCHKKEGAVTVKRLSDSKLVQDLRSLFTLGEIWTAEGDEELVQDHAITRS